MLYQTEEVKGNLEKKINGNKVFYGEGRGETGENCVHVPLKNHVAGSGQIEDHALITFIANNLIDYLLYERPVRGPEQWDYDAEKAGERYAVCGDNPNTSGIVIFDRNYAGGPKLHLSLDKTFGANEVAIRWKSGMVGDEFLLKDYVGYLKETYKSKPSPP